MLPEGGVSADGAVPGRLHVLLLLLDRADRRGQDHVHLQTSLETHLNSDGAKTSILQYNIVLIILAGLHLLINLDSRGLPLGLPAVLLHQAQSP